MFYQLIEKDGERRGVYSADDLRYMLSRGWKVVELMKAVNGTTPSALEPYVHEPEPQPVPQDVNIVTHRKRGRPRKVK